MLDLANEDELQCEVGVIKFGATWCGPCKKLEPVLTQLETEFPNITFMAVDLDQSPTLAKKYKIKSIPTLLFLKKGQEVERIIGLSLIEPIRKILRNLSE